MAALLNVDGGELDDEPLALYTLADVEHVACASTHLSIAREKTT